MCGFSACLSQGRQVFDTRNVPRALTWCIRSKRLIAISSVPSSAIALALLTTMSMPPKASAPCATAASTALSSRISQTTGRALPPASSISAAAV